MSEACLMCEPMNITVEYEKIVGKMEPKNVLFVSGIEDYNGFSITPGGIGYFIFTMSSSYRKSVSLYQVFCKPDSNLHLRIGAVAIFKSPRSRVWMHALKSATIKTAFLVSWTRSVVVLRAHVSAQTPDVQNK